MIKVKPLLSFTDKVENKRRYVGAEFETTPERAKELIDKKVCIYSELQEVEIKVKPSKKPKR